MRFTTEYLIIHTCSLPWFCFVFSCLRGFFFIFLFFFDYSWLFFLLLLLPLSERRDGVTKSIKTMPTISSRVLFEGPVRTRYADERVLTVHSGSTTNHARHRRHRLFAMRVCKECNNIMLLRSRRRAFFGSIENVFRRRPKWRGQHGSMSRLTKCYEITL